MWVAIFSSITFGDANDRYRLTGKSLTRKSNRSPRRMIRVSSMSILFIVKISAQECAFLDFSITHLL